MNFRHLLEERKLQERFLRIVNAVLVKQGLLMKEGTIVDATIIEAPSSTKNKKHLGESKGGTSISDYQMPMGVRESSIQRVIQKYHAAFCLILACQSVSYEKATSRYGMTREYHVFTAKNSQNQQKKIPPTRMRCFSAYP